MFNMNLSFVTFGCGLLRYFNICVIYIKYSTCMWFSTVYLQKHILQIDSIKLV